MSATKHASLHERWAQLRFAVIGQLLAAPPPKGQLRAQLKQLAARTWQHPVTAQPVRFALSTIERWLLRARRERRDPVAVLRRKVRADAGTQQIAAAVREALRAQYARHPSWSVYNCTTITCARWAKASARLPRCPPTPASGACSRHRAGASAGA